MGPLSRISWISGSFFLHPNPHGFKARSYGDLSSQSWKLGLFGLAWGWDFSLLRYPSWLLSTTHECGTPCSTTAATSPCHILSSSLSAPFHISTPPTCLDEFDFFKPFVARLHTVRFSDSSWYYLFFGLGVILSVVSWGGKVCLHTSPSWQEVGKILKTDLILL